MSLESGKPAGRTADAAAVSRWLGQVSHDLVKRLLWPARDRQELGGVPAPGELVARLADEEGGEIGAGALWRRLREEAPLGWAAGSLHAELGRALDGFGGSVERAEAAARQGDVAGVLRLAEAFSELQQQLKAAAGTTTKRE